MRSLAIVASLLLALFAPLTQAELIRLTVYDDGRSCPGNCDAHVVFHDSLRSLDGVHGTEFAHLPGGGNSRCVEGEKCEICIESGRKQCLEVIYRGRGPTVKTFDLTPAFFLEACANTPAQPALAAKCKQLKKEGEELTGRINCIANPSDPKCIEKIAKAKAAQELDNPKFELCARVGAMKYNKSKEDSEKRSDDCAYEVLSTGANSKGHTWHKLLPGACRAGSFVGPNGTDCCNGIPFEDGPKGVECRYYYPKL